MFNLTANFISLIAILVGGMITVITQNRASNLTLKNLEASVTEQKSAMERMERSTMEVQVQTQVHELRLAALERWRYREDNSSV